MSAPSAFASALDAGAGELHITRSFDAPRELVFKLWTEAEHVRRWWGPPAHPAAVLEMDVRPGGAWRGCLHGVEDGRQLWQGGMFQEVKAPERLVFTFSWDEDGERGLETLVTIDFIEQDGKTQLRFHQAPFQSVAERDGHQGGWNGSFDRFVDYLTQSAR